MSRTGTIIGLFILCLVVAVLFFHKQISQFLFEPEGLSMAAAELCAVNATSENLVADISVEGGARTVTFMVPGEKVCSASPEVGRSGKTRFSLQENSMPFCEQEALAGETVTLVKFAAPDDCGWKN